MVDAHNKHEENQKDFWKRIMGYVTFIIGIIIVLAGKGKNPNKVWPNNRDCFSAKANNYNTPDFLKWAPLFYYFKFRFNQL